jgi:hypothetical protein
MNVNFIHGNEALSKFTAYLKSMTDIDIHVRTRGKQSNIYTWYSYGIRPWNEVQCKVILSCFEVIGNLFVKKAPGYYKPMNISMILMDKDMNGNYYDFGYPYTVNNCIVVSTLFMTNLMNGYNQMSSTMSLSSLLWNKYRPNMNSINEYILILCHEYIHILQRYNSVAYDNMYHKVWNFTKINTFNITSCPFKLAINPDANNTLYLINLNNKFYMPLLIYNVWNKPEEIITEVYIYNSSIQILPNWTLIKNYKPYTRIFNDIEQLSHPNEIFAQILSNYIISDRTLGKYETHRDLKINS